MHHSRAPFSGSEASRHKHCSADCITTTCESEFSVHSPCCKSPFALVIKNSPGCRRDFRVKMWGTSSPDDKLTGDLGNVIETTQIGGRRSDRLTAGKLSPGNFGLLQQYRHIAGGTRFLPFLSASQVQPTFRC